MRTHLLTLALAVAAFPAALTSGCVVDQIDDRPPIGGPVMDPPVGQEMGDETCEVSSAVAVVGTITTNEDEAVVITVLDRWCPGTSVAFPARNHGDPTAIYGQAGDPLVVRFTPHTDYNGPASFRYSIVDADGSHPEVSVAVEVRPVNDCPNPGFHEVSTLANSPITFRPLAQDGQGFGDGVYAVEIVTQPEVGEVDVGPITGNGGRLTPFTYVPNRDKPNWCGIAEFKYSVYDTDLDCGEPGEDCRVGIIEVWVNCLEVPDPDPPPP